MHGVCVFLRSEASAADNVPLVLLEAPFGGLSLLLLLLLLCAPARPENSFDLELIKNNVIQNGNLSDL